MKAKSAQQPKAATGMSLHGNSSVAGFDTSSTSGWAFARHPLAATVSGLLMAGAMGQAMALPTGGNVVAGGADIASSSDTMVITQNGSSMIINWESFGIDAGEQVRFIQNASDVALNRVVGNDASLILGQLSASGHIFLINENGVLFGSGAQVDVGALVASTLDMSDADFLAGNYVFSGDGSQGSVVNEGDITVAPGGFAALIGSQAINSGLISAHMGSVVLAAGDRVSMSMDGTGLINLAVDKGRVDALAENAGLIQADGGLVLLSARSAGDLLATVVNNSGVIEAHSLVERDGVIRLEAGSKVENTGVIGKEANAGLVADGAGIVTNSGVLDTSGAEVGADGGDITLSGSRVGVTGALLASAGEGGEGGSILVTSSDKTLVTSSAVINVAAGEAGDAGSVVVWSDGATIYSGSILASGGSSAGDGGRVEVSGLDSLTMVGSVDIAANNGEGGTLLLDPTTITIIEGAGGLDTAAADGVVLESDADNGNNSISRATLENLAANTHLILQASDTITLGDLTLISGGTVKPLTLTQLASVTFTVSNGNFTFADVRDRILVNDADVTINTATGMQLGSIYTQGGSLTLNAGGFINILGAINTTSSVDGVTDGTVRITSKGINIGAVLNAGDSVVTLNALDGRDVYVGTVSGDDSDPLSTYDYKLDDGEVLKITASKLIVDNLNADILVGKLNAVDMSLSLISDGAIQQVAGLGGMGIEMSDVGAGAGTHVLTLRADGGDIGSSVNGLTFTLGTNTSVSANTSAGTGDIYLASTSALDTSKLAISTNAASAQTVDVTAAGNITVGAPLNLGNDNVSLTANQMFANIIVSSAVTGTGSLDLVGDVVRITTGSLNLGAGTISIQPYTAGTDMQLGDNASDSAGVALTNDELAKITATGGLTIGGATQTGDITITGTATTVNGTPLTLVTMGSINGTGRLSSAADLSLNAGTGIGDIAGSNPLKVGSVGGVLSATNSTSGDLYISTSGSVTLGGSSALISQHDDGDLKIVSEGGNILIAGDIEVGGNGSISLDAIGSISEASPSAGTLRASQVTLGGNGTTQSIGGGANGAVLTETSSLDLTSSNGGIQVSNTGDVDLVAQAHGGDIDVYSSGNINVAQNITGTDDITLSSGGLFTLSAGTLDTTGAANTITINADGMNIGSTIGDAADTVVLTSATTGKTIKLGTSGVDTGTALELSNAELNHINGTLIIGDTATSGDIVLVGAVNRAGLLDLRSAGTITDDAAGVLSSPVSALVATAAKGITLDNAHNVADVTLTNTTSGNITYNSSVGTGNTVDMTATNSGPGNITLSEQTGILDLSGATANGGDIRVTSGTLNINGTVMSGGGDVQYVADAISFNADTYAGTGNVGVTTRSPGNVIRLGAADADPSTLDLTSVQLATLHGDTLVVGDAAQTGGILVVGNTTAGTDNLSLVTGASILGQGGTLITDGTLGLQAASGIGSLANPLSTAAGALDFANGSTGDVVIDNSKAGTTTVSGSNANPNGSIIIEEMIGNMDIGAAGITAAPGSSRVVLTTSGVSADITDSGAGVVGADAVFLDASGGIGANGAPVMTATSSLNTISRDGATYLDNTGNVAITATTIGGGLDVSNTGTLETSGALNAAGDIDVTSTGNMTIDENVTALTDVNLTVSGAGGKLSHTAGAIDSTNNTGIVLTADKMALTGGTIGNSSADSVTLQTNNVADDIILGGAAANSGDNTAGALELSQAEVNTITGDLHLGSNLMTGGITVSGPVVRTNAGDINLITSATGNAIAINNDLGVQGGDSLNLIAYQGSVVGSGDLSGGNLNVTAADGINLDGDNRVANVDLALTNPAGGDINYVSNLGLDQMLTVTADNAAAGGSISINEKSADLTTHDITSQGGPISVGTHGVDAVLTQAGTLTSTGGGHTAGAGIALYADDMNLNGGTINAGTTGTVSLTSGNANQAIALGVDATTPGSVLGLTNVELNTISGALLVIGDAAHTASIAIEGNVAPAVADLTLLNGSGDIIVGANATASSDLTVTTSGGAIVGDGGTLSATHGNLLLHAADGIGDDASGTPVNIGTVGGYLGATNTTSGDLYLHTASSVTLGNKTGTVGIYQQVVDGLLRIDANGDLNIAGDLTVDGAGTITLDSTGNISSMPGIDRASSGQITASTLNIGMDSDPTAVGSSAAPLLTNVSNLNAHSASGLFIDNVGDLRAALSADAGDIVLRNVGTFTTTGDITADGPVLTSKVNISSTGDMSIGHDVLANAAVNLTTTSAGKIISQSAGLIDADSIILTSDKIDLHATAPGDGVGADAATLITIVSTTAGNAMVLGSGQDNTLELSNTELSTITGDLTLGSLTSTGTITTAGSVDRTSTGDLNLITAASGNAVTLGNNLTLANGDLTINAANGRVSGDGDLAANSLSVRAASGIDLGGDNAIASVLLNNSTSGDISYHSDNVTGLTLSATNAASGGNVSVEEMSGDLTISSAGISTVGGDVELITHKVKGLLTIDGVVDTTQNFTLAEGGDITLTADDMDINAALRSRGATTVTLDTATAAQIIDLGADSVTRESLGLTDAELNLVKSSSGELVIGSNTHTGLIRISQDVAPMGVKDLSLINQVGGIALNADLSATNDLSLIANGGGSTIGAIQGAAGTLNAGGQLTLNAASGIGTIGATSSADAPIHLGNVGSVSAVNTTSGDLFLHTRSITLGGATSTLSQADNGVLRVDAEGDITLAGNLSVGGTNGKISLDAINGLIVNDPASTGVLTAAHIDLGMQGSTLAIGSGTGGAIRTASSDLNLESQAGMIRVANTGNALLNAEAVGGRVEITNTGTLTTDQGGVSSDTSTVSLTSTGAMTINQDVTAESGITLSVTGAGQMLTHSSGIIDANNALISLSAGKMNLSGGTIGTASGDTVQLSSNVAGSGIILGSTSDGQAGNVELSSAELNTIANAALIIGGASTTGNIQVTGPVDVQGASSLTLENHNAAIIIANTLNSKGDLSLIANSGGSTVGAISGTSSGLLSTASDLTLSAATGIGNIASSAPVRIGNVGGSLAAENTTSGDLYLLSTKSITLGTATTSLDEADNGHLRVDVLGNMLIGGPLTVGGATGTITLNATGSLANDSNGGGVISANTVRIGTSNAPSDVGGANSPILTAVSVLNLNSAGDLYVDNTGNATLALNAVGLAEVNNVGSLSSSGTIHAGDTLSLDSTGVMTISHNTMGEDGVDLTVSSVETLFIHNGGTINANDAEINITADKMALSGTAIGDSAGDTVQLSAYTASHTISLGATADTTASTLELSEAELRTISNAALVIGGADATGTIVLKNNVVHNGNSDITLENHAGGIIIGANFSSSQDLTLIADGGSITRPTLGTLSAVGGNLALIASNGIGTIIQDNDPTNDDAILVGTVGGILTANNSTSGHINIETTGAITLGDGSNVTFSGVPGNELRVVSGGTMTLAGDLNSVGGTLTLEANGDILEQSAGASTLTAATINFGTVGTHTIDNIGGADAPLLTSATTALTALADGDIYLENTGNLGAFRAVSTGGLVDMLNTGELKTSGVLSARDTFTITTQSGVAGALSSAALTVTGNLTGTNGVYLTAGDGAMLSHTGGVIDGNDAEIHLVADRMELAGTSIGNAAGDKIFIDTNNPAINIDLGSGINTSANTLELKAAEINTLIGDVTIGSSDTTGAITVSQAITRNTVGDLNLINRTNGITFNADLKVTNGDLTLTANGDGTATTGAITANASGGVTPMLQANSLTAVAATGISLTGNNQVASVDLSNTKGGNINYASSRSAGLSVQGENGAVDGTFTVTEKAGNLTVSGRGITTAGGDITLGTTLAGGLFQLDGVVDATQAGLYGTADAQISIKADDMRLGQTIDSGSAGHVTLSTATASRITEVGGTTSNTAGTLGLTDAELDLVHTDTLEIGDLLGHSGEIKVVSAVLPNNATNLTLSTSGKISNATAGSLSTVGNLQLNAGTGIGGDIATASNPLVIDTVGGYLGATNTTSGNIYLRALNDIVLGGESVSINEKVANGTIKVEGYGDISLGGNLFVDAGNSGTIILDADTNNDGTGGVIEDISGGSAVVTAATVNLGNYGKAGGPTTTRIGTATDAVQTDAAILRSSTTGDSYLENNGDVTFTALSEGGHVSLTNTGMITTAVAVDALQVTLKADDLKLTNGAPIGHDSTASVTLSSRTGTDTLVLGAGSDTAGDAIVSLTQSEIDNVLGHLTVGGSDNSGNIQVSSSITRATSGLHLYTTGSGSVSGNGVLNVPDLQVSAGSGINLSGDNLTGRVHLANTGSGNISYTTALAGTTYLSGNNQAAGGTISVIDKSGLLQVADNSLYITGALAGLRTSNGNVTLTTDHINVAQAVNVGSGIVTVTAYTNGNGFDLGSTTDANASAVELSAAEVSKVTASVLRIGDITTKVSGDIQVTNAITAGGVLAMHLTTTGNIAGSGSLNVSGLALEAAGVDLQGNNDVTTIAGIIGGPFTFNDVDDLKIGTVDGVVGLSVAGNGLLSTGGALTQTSSGALSVTGDLGIVSAGPVTLGSNANHLAGDVAVAVSGSGNGLTLATDSTGLTVGTVNDASGSPIVGMSTDNGAVTLSSAGTLTVASGVDAGSAKVTYTADTSDLQATTTAGSVLVTANDSTMTLTLGGSSNLGDFLSAAELATLQTTDLEVGTLDDGPIQFNGAVDLSAGPITDLTLNSKGPVTQTAGSAVSVDNLTINTQGVGGGVTLSDSGNDVDTLTASVGYAANGSQAVDGSNNPVVADLIFNDSDELNLGTIKVTGDMLITTNGDLTGHDTIVVQGATVVGTDGALDGVGTGNGDVVLDNANNDFVGGFGVEMANDVTVVDKDALELGPVMGKFNMEGDLSVTAGGAITDNAQLNVAGNATFDAGYGNEVTIDPDYYDGDGNGVADDLNGDFTLTDADKLKDNIGGTISVVSAGDVTIIDAGNTSVGDINSNGDVSIGSDGNLVMTPDAVIDTTLGNGEIDLSASGDIGLGQLITDGNVTIISGGNVYDNNDVGGNPLNNITAAGGVIEALTGYVGTLDNPIEVDISGKLFIYAAGYDSNGVSIDINGTTGDNTLHVMNNTPGLVIFNGVPLFGRSECTGMLGLTCEAYLAATGGNIRITLDNGDVILAPSTVRHLDGLVTLVNSMSRERPVDFDFDTWMNEQDAGGGLIVPSDSGSITLPDGVVMNHWDEEPTTAVASLDLYGGYMAR